MTSGAGMHPRHEWVALAVQGQITETLYGLSTIRAGGRDYTVAVGPDDDVVFESWDDGALYLVEVDVKVTAVRKTSTGEVRPLLSAPSSTPPDIGIDTCRHQRSTGGVVPRKSEGPRSRPGH